MAADSSEAVTDRAPDAAFERLITLHAGTVFMGTVVGLTFLFGGMGARCPPAPIR
jgi:hypothetical protein